MSFADRVREELCELPVKNACCRRALVAGLHTRLLEERASAFCEQAELQEVVELRGTVERELRRGCVLSTGWNGVRVALRGALTSEVLLLEAVEA